MKIYIWEHIGIYIYEIPRAGIAFGASRKQNPQGYIKRIILGKFIGTNIWIYKKNDFIWKFIGKKGQVQVTGIIFWFPGNIFYMAIERYTKRIILYKYLEEK